MTNNHKDSKTNGNSKLPKNTSEEFYEVEIEKNFFIKIRNNNKARLEKWSRLTGRNFNRYDDLR